MPKILRDTQRDCGKPGCRNDYHMQVLARGDEMIGEERRLPLVHRAELNAREVKERGSSGRKFGVPSRPDPFDD
jgi:hypothetical protein